MKKPFENIKKVVIVLVDFEKESTNVRACVVKKDQKELPVIHSFEQLEGVFKYFGKSVPYLFHVTGTGVLNRLTDDILTYQDQLIVNADTNSFSFTSFSDGKQRAVSFVRNDLLKPMLELFEEQKVFLFSLTSGYVPLFLTLKNKQIKSIDTIYLIEYKNGQINQFERNSIHLSEDKASVFQKIAEALAFSIFQYDQSFEQAIEQKELEKNTIEFNYFKRYSTVGTGFVLALLLLVILNFFYQKNLNSKVVSLEEEMLLHSENLNLLDNLKQEKERKSVLVQNSGIKSKYFISFYLDKIASSVPADINLLGVTVFPLKESLKENKKVEFQQTKIEISGNAGGSKIIEFWLESLNRFAWVNSVEVTNFSKTTGSNSTFTLTIWIKA